MNIRDWLAVILILFIVLILLDGFRRKWLERKNRIVMKLDKNIPAVDIEDEADVLTRSELPAGGARIKPRTSATALSDESSEEDVPVLMESVDIDSEDIEEYFIEEEADEALYEWADEDSEDDEELSAAETEIDDWDENAVNEYEDADESHIDQEEDQEESEEDSTDIELEDDSVPDQNKSGLFGSKQISGRDTEGRIEPTFGDEDLTFGRDDQGELDLEHHDLIDHEPLEDDEGDEEQGLAEEVLIINVMSRPDLALEGSKLLPVLLKHGMRLGDMSIFHRHADSDGKGPVMFSMANMLKPGTFSLADMEQLTTPGVSFFMQLPNKLGNIKCFEQMLKTAQAVKEELDAELKDENRSVFTRQTIEHSRQRISDFELEMLARK